MKIAIASSISPFVEGGSTYIVRSLAKQLESLGHSVDVLWLPFDDDPGSVLPQLLAYRLLDISEHGDRLIAIRTPAHLLQHPRKVTWFIHHYRGAYDLWGTRYQALPATTEGMAIRDAIIAADNLGLRETTRLFANSAVVRDRLAKFNGVNAAVLYPPLSDEGRFYVEEYGDFILYFARLTHHKRQWLAIEAMCHTRTCVRLVIAGPADPGAEWYVEELRSSVARHGLNDRVEIMPHWISEPEKLALFASCLCLIYCPFDEDSYGYPSLEAHAARKAVVTTTDSGATNELIIDGRNGLVTPADPELIADAMDKLYTDRGLARTMGEEGRTVTAELGIGWGKTIQRLLE